LLRATRWAALTFFWFPGSVPKSSSGGTGFPACVDRLAGEDARATDFSSSQV